MINVLRKNQKALWTVIALLCIPFVFYFSNADIGALGSKQFGRIYDRPISIIEFQRNARLFDLARHLGMSAFLENMVPGATSLEDAYTDFTWNRLILRHEAERLGIQPASQQIVPIVQGLQAFRGEKGFDLNKYDEFVKLALPSMGFGEAQIEELVADQITLEQVKEILGVGVQIPEAESKADYERVYGKLTTSVVRLRSEDLAKEIQIND